jgi:hypothetical protein
MARTITNSEPGTQKFSITTTWTPLHRAKRAAANLANYIRCAGYGSDAFGNPIMIFVTPWRSLDIFPWDQFIPLAVG